MPSVERCRRCLKVQTPSSRNQKFFRTAKVRAICVLALLLLQK
jgi:hypothetical protein